MAYFCWLSNLGLGIFIIFFLIPNIDQWTKKYDRHANKAIYRVSVLLKAVNKTKTTYCTVSGHLVHIFFCCCMRPGMLRQTPISSFPWSDCILSSGLPFPVCWNMFSYPGNPPNILRGLKIWGLLLTRKIFIFNMENWGKRSIISLQFFLKENCVF